MTTLKELKQKYSGQAVPEWELVKAGLKPGETTPTPAPEPVRRAKVKKEEVVEAAPAVDEVTPDGDGD